MTQRDPTDATALLRAERDLCLKLLELSAHTDCESFLDEALVLLRTITGARCGYVSLGASVSEPHFTRTAGLTRAELAQLRQTISHGIVAASLKTGQTIATASAVSDPRFADNVSVRAAKIEAVLCAPIGADSTRGRAVGVIYLQGRPTAGPFGEHERRLVELFARHIAPICERLLRATSELRGVDPTAPWREKLKVSRLVGRSQPLAKLLHQIHVAAQVDMGVLIDGESGTGKTEVARCLHDSSARRAGPFVALNCAAIPELLFESELFGAEKGAHSQATRRMVGKIEAAQHGTLFLDEVAELPLGLQAKLLQFLQDKMYFRLGSTTPMTADVRVLAATNAELDELVAAKRFREDLKYRLDGFAIHVPPLRARREDIVLIAEAMLAQSNQSQAKDRQPLTLSWEARTALTEAQWPGNIRQLAAALQRAIAHAHSEQTDSIDVRHLWDAPESAGAEAQSIAAGRAPLAVGSAAEAQRAQHEAPIRAVNLQTNAVVEWDEALRIFQREHLHHALEHCKWNVTETSRALGLARSHLYELMRLHGLSRAARSAPTHDPSSDPPEGR
jgi:DNA-binding NtrC family response regulator